MAPRPPRGARTVKIPEKARAVLVSLARLVVAGVFIYAALPKIWDPVAFAGDIANYRVPHWIWNGAAGVVPMLELFGALALLHPRHYRSGAMVLGALTLIFLALIYSVIVRGIDIHCGCFGQEASSNPVGWGLFLRDLGLLALIVIAAFSRRHAIAPNNDGTPA